MLSSIMATHLFKVHHIATAISGLSKFSIIQWKIILIGFISYPTETFKTYSSQDGNSHAQQHQVDMITISFIRHMIIYFVQCVTFPAEMLT